MNTTTKYIAGAFGAIALFVSTFICAAAMSGTPLHELAVVGGLFPEPTRASLTASDPAPRIQAEVRPASEILRNQLSILGSFRMPSEMTSDAILTLQEDLRTRTAALAERFKAMQEQPNVAEAQLVEGKALYERFKISQKYAQVDPWKKRAEGEYANEFTPLKVAG